MRMSGWGQYPYINTQSFTPDSVQDLINLLTTDNHFCGIARGMGRSYGDSGLAKQSVNMLRLNHILAFDNSTGKVRCSAGISLSELIEVFLPKGWFFRVTPGTKYISVGGAIAADVHGKNHHLEGSFCDHLDSFQLLLASGEIVKCSNTDNTELFRATCGGMGLTGIIVEATFFLRDVNTSILKQKIIASDNLDELFMRLDEDHQSLYSVAWLDCLSRGKASGRSMLILGEHCAEGELSVLKRRYLSVPFNMPNFLLNRLTSNVFNEFYYFKNRYFPGFEANYDSFFYPLDHIQNWNRIYGRGGFMQYQFLIPETVGLEAMRLIHGKILQSQSGSFLSVLKKMGAANENYLSFPLKGYTLALDFKVNAATLKLLTELDAMVLDYGGRLYLCKDARMSQQVFRQSYPNWEKFYAIREKTGAKNVFQSLQSQRLGL